MSRGPRIPFEKDQPVSGMDTRLGCIDRAIRHDLPTGDIGRMLAEIETPASTNPQPPPGSTERRVPDA